ncbi:NUDIX hydrolase [Thermosynechococcus sp. HN-54]|uniref:NUDIX hydrolase n=1 Tax=Thermosynechococcus sp. HN-54 TaxID=2933959 RepID=UPI00202CF8AF|nr:NUDIX hydrolase [Thermosynechococcus sp. HN-54]URR36754.1 NUDIX hydrolase [Thermosynechococcus sp. HN-54]
MATVNWRSLNELVRIQSKWVTLIAEQWLTEKGETLEYWRVEKADSVIILTLQGDYLICLPPTFRVGIRRATVDFPGGRVLPDQTPMAMVPQILARELGTDTDSIQAIASLNEQPWLINSAFSNQRLWGFIAELAPTAPVPRGGSKFRLESPDIPQLLAQLECLQCRAVLLEWLSQRRQA